MCFLCTPAAGFVKVATSTVLATSMSLGFAASPVTMHDDIDERLATAQENARQLEQSRRGLETALEETNDRLTQAAIRLNEVEARLPVAQAELERAEAELATARREAEVLAGRLQDAEEEEAAVRQRLEDDAGKVEAARSSIAQLAREQARGQGQVSALGVATGAQSTEHFLRTLTVSSSAARAQSRTLTALQDAEAQALNQEARLKAVTEIIAQLKQAAEENVVRAQIAEQAAVERKAEVQGLIDQQRALTNELRTEKALTLEHLDAIEEDQRQAAAEIRQLRADQEERDRIIEERRRQEAERLERERLERERQERERQEQERQRQEEEDRRRREAANAGNAAPAPAPAPAPPARPAPAPPPPAATSFLTFPVANPHITSPFGMRMHPVLGVRRMHNGTDFRAWCGTPILASNSGIVVRAHSNSGAGNYVTIDHGRYDGRGVMTRYTHLQSRSVRLGDWVERGQVIGHSGSTGTSTACHLHFEVWVNGSVVDPMTWLPRIR